VSAPFRYDRRFDFDVAPAGLWDALGRTDEYPSWWSWLRDLEGGELREGAVAHCVVQAPLPYALRFDVEVQRVVPERRVETMVCGDLDGPALLEIEPRGAGCTARLEWSLELRDRLLRPLSSLARPAMVWAHDRVIEVGLREFERRALDGRGT
jgi:Polyketide cyclase / dehydrase and lipid transport